MGHSVKRDDRLPILIADVVELFRRNAVAPGSLHVVVEIAQSGDHLYGGGRGEITAAVQLVVNSVFQ